MAYPTLHIDPAMAMMALFGFGVLCSGLEFALQALGWADDQASELARAADRAAAVESGWDSEFEKAPQPRPLESFSVLGTTFPAARRETLVSRAARCINNNGVSGSEIMDSETKLSA